MKTYTIELTTSADDCYDISNLIKSSNLKSTKCLLKNTNEIIDINIKMNGSFDIYVFCGEKEYCSWEISKIILEFELESKIIQGDVYTFDELVPIGTYDIKKNVPIGNYICKLVNLKTMEISYNVLNVNKNICTCGRLFLFDMEKYSILELIELK